MAILALRHVRWAGRKDLDRSGLGPRSDDGDVSVRHRRHLHALLRVARIAVIAGGMAHHASVHAKTTGELSVRLLAEGLCGPVIGRSQIERRRVALSTLTCRE